MTRPANAFAGVAAGAFAALLACPAVAGAQSVMGQVLDAATRRPLAGVPVRLRRARGADSAAGVAADTAPVAEAVTQSDGVFALMAPDSGTYQVHIGSGFAGPVLRLARDGDDQRVYMVPAPEPDRAFTEREVARQAAYVRGSGERIDMRSVLERASDAARPLPPGRTAFVVVVGVDGRAEPGSARLVSASDLTYGEMARHMVQTGRFTPALLDGRPVRQRLRVPVDTQIRTEVRVMRVGP